MARSNRHLRRWEVIAIILVAVLYLPAMMVLEGFGHPQAVTALLIAGYAGVVGLFGFLAWVAWSAWWIMGLSYRKHADPAGRSLGRRVKTLLRDPWPLYFAILLTAAMIGMLIHIVREIARRTMSPLSP